MFAKLDAKVDNKVSAPCVRKKKKNEKARQIRIAFVRDGEGLVLNIADDVKMGDVMMAYETETQTLHEHECPRGR